MRPHFASLYRTAHRLSRNTADAEDLVQELCIRAYPRLSELQQLDKPRAWLQRVLYRLFVDMTRRQRSSPVRSMDELAIDELESDCRAEMASHEPGPDAQAEGALAEARLDRAWQRLDKVQQTLLALHDVEGYSLAELQEMSGLPQGTLKSRLHRARIRLGKLLQRESVSVVDFASAQEG